MAVPYASGPSLADISPSAAAAIGVPGYSDLLGIGPARHVVVCLIDGLGWAALDAHRDRAPHLAALSGRPIHAAFPSTTPVGLGSLGTGLLPGGHGLMGAAFEFPETGEILSPLQWGTHPTPVAVQPEPTVFEQVARSGVRVTTIAPGAYRESGLTRAALRGAEYVPAEDIPQRIQALQKAQASGESTFTYVYWPELDRTGHEFGVDSDQWRRALGRVDALVEGLAQAQIPGSAMVVTADHGMLDCPAASHIDLEADARLMSGVRRIAGEPRARHVYVHEGAAAEVQAAWAEVLGERALVLSRHQLVEAGYFGEVEPGLEERIGDVMAVPHGDWMLTSVVDPTVSGLIGQHGGLTEDELLIPALVCRAS